MCVCLHVCVYVCVCVHVDVCMHMRVCPLSVYLPPLLFLLLPPSLPPLLSPFLPPSLPPSLPPPFLPPSLPSSLPLTSIDCDLEGRFSYMRTQETNLGNLVTDIMKRATRSDIALLNSGTFRSDSIHEAGRFKVKV